jgi:hypothetical protein
MEEMIKIFKEMDCAISDIFKQIMSDKAPIFEDHEVNVTPPDFNEASSNAIFSDQIYNYYIINVQKPCHECNISCMYH